LDPNWEPVKLDLETLLVHADAGTQLLIQCFDWDATGSDDLIGEFTTSYAEWRRSVSHKLTFALIEPKLKKITKDYKDSGELTLDYKELWDPCYIDYVTSGTEISVCFGIGYSASNGDPKLNESLHFFKLDQLNEYQAAIQVIGNIVAPYDNDKLFPAFGIGGKIDGKISQCFALNFDEHDPNLNGIPKVLEAYTKSFEKSCFKWSNRFCSDY